MNIEIQKPLAVELFFYRKRFLYVGKKRKEALSRKHQFEIKAEHGAGASMTSLHRKYGASVYSIASWY